MPPPWRKAAAAEELQEETSSMHRPLRATKQKRAGKAVQAARERHRLRNEAQVRGYRPTSPQVPPPPALFGSCERPVPAVAWRAAKQEEDERQEESGPIVGRSVERPNVYADRPRPSMAPQRRGPSPPPGGARSGHRGDDDEKARRRRHRHRIFKLRSVAPAAHRAEHQERKQRKTTRRRSSSQAGESTSGRSQSAPKRRGPGYRQLSPSPGSPHRANTDHKHKFKSKSGRRRSASKRRGPSYQQLSPSPGSPHMESSDRKHKNKRECKSKSKRRSRSTSPAPRREEERQYQVAAERQLKAARVDAAAIATSSKAPPQTPPTAIGTAPCPRTAADMRGWNKDTIARSWTEGDLYTCYNALGRKRELIAAVMVDRDLALPRVRQSVGEAAAKIQRSAQQDREADATAAAPRR